MTEFVHVLATAILLLALVVGLLLAMISPFASYRYLISHGYGGRSLRHFWVRETLKGEVWAALIIAGGAATSGWILLVSLPRNSPIRYDVLVGLLILGVVLAVIGPLVEYRRLGGRVHEPGAFRAWVKEAVGWELPASVLITCAAMQLARLGTLLGQVSSLLFTVLFIAYAIVYLSRQIRREQAGEGASAHAE